MADGAAGVDPAKGADAAGLDAGAGEDAATGELASVDAGMTGLTTSVGFAPEPPPHAARHADSAATAASRQRMPTDRS